MDLNIDPYIRHISHKIPRRNKFLRLGSSLILTSLLGGVASNSVSYIDTSAKAIEVSEDFANNFSSDLIEVPDGVFPFDKNAQKIVNLDSSNIDIDYDIYRLNCGNCLLSNNPIINDKSIASLRSVELDMTKNSNLQVLKYCTNMIELIIINAQRLSKEDIECIKEANPENLRLVFNYYEIIQDKNSSLDISKLKNISNITIVDEDYLGELSALTIYNYLNLDDTYNISFETSNFNTNFCIKDIMIKDEKLDNIVAKLNLKDNSDEEKFLKIVKYVLQKIEYDNYVSLYLDDEYDNNSYLNKYSKDLIHWYNIYDISTVLTNSYQTREGICINYASLVAILGYKVGLNIMFVNGFAKDYLTGERLGGHAWNICNLDGNYKYFDLTCLDNYDNYYCNRIDNCLNDYDSYVDKYKLRYKEIINSILDDLDEDYYSIVYESRKDLGYYTEKVNENVKFINETIAGQMVNNNFKPNYWGGFYFTIIFNIIYNFLKKVSAEDKTVGNYGLKKKKI